MPEFNPFVVESMRLQKALEDLNANPLWTLIKLEVETYRAGYLDAARHSDNPQRLFGAADALDAVAGIAERVYLAQADALGHQSRQLAPAPEPKSSRPAGEIIPWDIGAPRGA